MKPKAKIVMNGKIDCIMHGCSKQITPSNDTPEKALNSFPKQADVDYSKLWIVLDGSDPENPWWLEIERPMIPSCEWKRKNKNFMIQSGQRVRVTMEIVEGEKQ